MRGKESGYALFDEVRGCHCRAWGSGTLRELEVRPGETANTSMNIPDATGRGTWAIDVELEQDGTLLLPLRGHDHVGPLNYCVTKDVKSAESQTSWKVLPVAYPLYHQACRSGRPAVAYSCC